MLLLLFAALERGEVTDGVLVLGDVTAAGSGAAARGDVTEVASGARGDDVAEEEKAGTLAAFGAFGGKFFFFCGVLRLGAAFSGFFSFSFF